MIVIGADPHKSSHTAAAVDLATGELRSSETVAAKVPGLEALLLWGREIDSERVWAIEDCRHVSGNLERFLVVHGERVVRVPPKLMAGARASERQRGKSDPIDAQAVARAALREGLDTLPCAFLDQEAMDIKLWLDHRQNLVGEHTDLCQRLRWHLHDLWPDFHIPEGALDRLVWIERVARRLQRAEQTVRVQVAREQVRRLRELTKRRNEIERDIAALVKEKNPQLLEIPGCGSLTAAKLIAETAGAKRFGSDAKFARMAGVAPIPVSSGRKDRQRLDRGGNRQLNCALHRIAVTQGRVHEPARRYLARKQAEGKSRMEALRCLKRQLARTVLRALRPPTADTENRSISSKMTNLNNRQALVGLT